MKKSLVLAMAMALGVTASAYAANPFSDVPAGHWAYDSVAKLAAAGVVDGYTDGAFAGDKLITRYEMAQIVAKAMAKGANVDKLAAEFADELDTLGVRVAKLEKGADKVKITGNIRYNYAEHDLDGSDSDENKLRTRIWVKGEVNEDWSYTGMIEHTDDYGDDDNEDSTVYYQRAYVNGKVGGMKVQAGRYNNNIMDGNIYDSRFDGVQVEYGKDLKLKAAYGKATPSTEHFTSDEVMTVELSGKVGVLGLTAGYYDFKDVEAGEKNAWVETNLKEDTLIGDTEIMAVQATLPLAKDLKLSGIYLTADTDGAVMEELDDDGYVVALNYKGAKASVPGSWGLTAKWYDQGRATYVDHTMNGMADKLVGFEGWGLFANYTLAKNIVAQVEWYDLEEKQGDERDAETLWTQVVFTF